MSFIVAGIGAIGTGLTALGGGSLLVGGAAALSIGSTVVKGIGQMGNKKDVEAAEAGVEANYQNQLQKLTAQKDREIEGINMEYGTQSQQVSTQTGEALTTITEGASEVQNKQGFETSEESTVDTGKLLAGYNTDIQNLVASRKFQQEGSVLKMGDSREQLEDQKARQLMELSSIPTGFFG